MTESGNCSAALRVSFPGGQGCDGSWVRGRKSGYLGRGFQEEKKGTEWVGAGRKRRDKNSRSWGKPWGGDTMLIWILAKVGEPHVGWIYKGSF